MEKIWLKSYPPGVPAEAELGRMSAAFGAWLQSKGLPKGARVALMMPNVLQYPVCLYGTLRAGYTVVNVNPLYTPRELEHQLKDSGAEVIVVLENFANVLQEVVARTPVKHVVVASLGDMLGFKGAIVNFVVRNVKKMVPAFELPSAVRFNAISLTVNCLLMLKVGGLNVLITNPRDIPGFVKELAKHPYNVITGVNTLFNALLNNPEFNRLDFSKVKVCVGGGMAVQKAVADKWKQVTGKVLLEGYGLTETSPSATMNPLTLTDYSGAIGLPLPSTLVSIRDDDKKEVAQGEPGEICISGPQVMKGYWQRPEETASVIGPDGFLYTGDVGIMDPTGFVRIVDRKKDMILVSGSNVYPNEIEQVIAMHPGVLEVAPIGVNDEHSGEVPKVFIVKKDPALTEEAVLGFCKDQLTGYKRPKYVEFRTELPKTNVGKILRRALRDEAPAKQA